MDATSPNATDSAAAPRPPGSDPAAGAAPPRPIGELMTREDFPECLQGLRVDIGGYVGVVTAIVRQSIKVQSPEGTTTSYNVHTLRRIYGPRPELEPPPDMSPPEPPRRVPAEPARPEMVRQVIEQPDFTQEVRAIRQFASQRDFPECALGQHVDIRGFAGVVVEIVQRSLKVRSREGITLSFNADVLRKLHGH